MQLTQDNKNNSCFYTAILYTLDHFFTSNPSEATIPTHSPKAMGLLLGDVHLYSSLVPQRSANLRSSDYQSATLATQPSYGKNNIVSIKYI